MKKKERRRKKARPVNCALYSDVAVSTMTSQLYIFMEMPVTMCRFICNVVPNKHYIFKKALVL